MSGVELPPPAAFNLPSKFVAWRRYQPDAIGRIADSRKRWLGLVAATGSGKSLLAVAAAMMTGRRLLYLTASKGLQSQLMRDFGGVGMVDVRGRNNYPCHVVPGTTCDQGPCGVGWQCRERWKCAYVNAIKCAVGSQLVVTNYAYWMASQAADVDLGVFDLMVADEIHGVDALVSRYLEAELRKDDEHLRGWWPNPLPDSIHGWKGWAGEGVYDCLQGEEEALKGRLKEMDGGSLRDRRSLAKLRGAVEVVRKVKEAGEDWLVEVEDYGGAVKVRIGPVWPGLYAADVLWRDVPQVVMMSATLSRKTMDLLGVPEGDSELVEYPHTFPVASRPFIHVPTVRMNHRTTQDGLRLWVRRIDQIIDGRLDRNGIIHTVSYARRDFLLKHSRHSHLMITHGRRDTDAKVQAFKQRKASPPVILVSPSVATGFDFPKTECEYQIVGKVPYPDTTNKIVAARCSEDDTYGAYVAMMEMVQMVGRSMRSEDDRAQTLCVDDNCLWFMGKYGHLAPGWFKESYRRVSVIPQPLEKLEG